MSVHHKTVFECCVDFSDHRGHFKCSMLTHWRASVLYVLILRRKFPPARTLKFIEKIRNHIPDIFEGFISFWYF